MKNSLSYQIHKDSIFKERMQVTVINRHPAYSPEEEKTVKAGIEQQLFAVFCSYV